MSAHCTRKALEAYFSDSAPERDQDVSKHLVSCATCLERALRVSEGIILLAGFGAAASRNADVADLLPQALEQCARTNNSDMRRQRLNTWYRHVVKGARMDREPRSYSVRRPPRAANRVRSRSARSADAGATIETRPGRIIVDQKTDVFITETDTPREGGWLVLLIPVGGPVDGAQVSELTQVKGRKEFEAMFPDVHPGEYYVIFEPEPPNEWE